MNQQFNFAEIVSREMADLIIEYRLSVVHSGEEDVILRGQLYALRVHLDRDGVSIIYFDTSDSARAGYNVFLYLFNKRRSALSFSEERAEGSRAALVKSEVRSLADHLRVAGRDILSGDKNWLKDYSWPLVEGRGVEAVF